MLNILFAIQLLSKAVLEEAILRNVSVETSSQFASGVVIQTGYVLTCFHALQVESPVRVNGKPARVVAVDTERDLTILKVETVEVRPIRLAEKAELTENVFYVGNTNGHKDYVSIGFVTSLNDSYVYSSTAGVGGASGSGLYNFQGELVGLTEGEEAHVITVHVKFSVIGEFLKENRKALK